MLELYTAYLNGTGVERSPAKGMDWLQKAADAGSYKAAEALGVAYEIGFGVESDALKATQWKDKARQLKSE